MPGHSIWCLIVCFLLQTLSIRVQLFNSTSSKANIYYCKDIRSCSSFDHNQLLFRTTVTINGSRQNRWYVEKVFSSEADPNEKRRIRVLGAIEVSPYPNLLLKPWKRISEDGSTGDAPEIQMSIMNNSTSIHMFSTILSDYHELTIVPDLNQSKMISTISEVSSNVDTAFPLRKMLECEKYLLLRSFLSAGVCYREFLSHIRPSELDLEGVQLFTHLQWRAIRFMFLFGEAPDVLARLVALCFRSLNDMSSSEHYPFYTERLSAIHNLFHFYFGGLYSNEIPLSLGEKEIFALKNLNEFVDLELNSWAVAVEYLTKLQTVTSMMKTYADKQYPIINLFASIGNYAIQSGAVEQAVAFLCAGIEHTVGQIFTDDTPTSSIISQTKSLESYLLRLQYYLVANNVSRGVLLSDSDILQSYLSTLTQAGMPVILTIDSQPTSTWWETAIALRKIVIDTLEELQQLCKTEKEVTCFLHVHHRGAGVRGLFLAAYQGVSLVEKLQLPLTKNIPTRYLRDTTLPVAYYEFLDSVKFGNEVVTSLVHNSGFADFQVSSRTDSSDKKTKPISIVFVCYSLSRHSVGRLLAKLIKHVTTLRHADNSFVFDVFIITDRYHPSDTRSPSAVGYTKAPDEIFLDIASLFAPSDGRWLTLPAFDFNPKRMSEVFEAHFHRDDTHSPLFDIAVFSDLLMQASQCIWAHELRIAEHQVLFWGHPQTSGMSKTMDYYVTSASFEDEEEPLHGRSGELRHAQFVEQLVQFDSLSFVLYDPEPVGATLPGETPTEHTPAFDRHGFVQWLQLHSESLSTGSPESSLLKSQHSSYRFYGSVQTLMKHHPLLDHMLFTLLRRDPQAIVVLLKGSRSQAHWFLRFQRRLMTSFLTLRDSLAVVDPVDIDEMMHRIRWIEPMPHPQYARLVCQLHVNLDPFVFGGGVTLCDGVAGACPMERDHYHHHPPTAAADAPNAHSDIKHAMDPFHNSVGFVTAGILQTVHHLGAGIAAHINDTSLAVNVPTAAAAAAAAIATSRYNGTQLLDHLLAQYVDEAIRLAKEAEWRRLPKKSEDDDNNKNINNNKSSSNWTDTRRRIDHLIYHNQQVLDEYVRFFRRLAQ